jgi:hypothetical protein
MKDIIVFILIYLVWNSPVHEQHPTAVPVLTTLYVTLVVVDIIVEFLKKN